MGVITLEMLWQIVESIDNSNKSQFEKTKAMLEKIENSIAKRSKEALNDL
jgi:hypothetical protein